MTFREIGRNIPDGATNDVSIFQLPHMAVYIRFCSCQLNAAALIQRKTENDGHFREVMKVSFMTYSHTRRRTRIPLRGRGPELKMGTVAIYGWGSVPFCVQCAYFFIVQL